MLQPHELDTSTTDVLMSFWYLTNTNPIRTARKLFPTKPDRFVATTRDLGQYASNKATAQTCRLLGNIEDALYYERICETIYNRLPDYARW